MLIASEMNHTEHLESSDADDCRRYTERHSLSPTSTKKWALFISTRACLSRITLAHIPPSHHCFCNSQTSTAAAPIQPRYQPLRMDTQLPISSVPRCICTCSRLLTTPAAAPLKLLAHGEGGGMGAVSLWW
ncbi:hypothetical protein BASA61_003453 [Batrachochytrium salamandrivorans]|nr:hypothetical protein BASA61_003453 [Batrachochytrium salamandrivorans]